VARISIEQQALTDSRFTQLGLLIYGLHKPAAPEENLCPTALGIGVAAHIWNECQEQGRHVLDSVAVNSIGFHLGIRNGESLSLMLVECDLAERIGRKQLRIKGTEGRTEWLQKRREEGQIGAKYGVTGGRPRKPPTGLPEKPPPTPTPTPTQEIQKLPLPNPPQAAARAGWSALFPEFWNVYPRKIAKRDAEKAWAKLAPKSSDLIEPKALAIAYVLRDRKQRDWAGRDPDRIPYPATFLNAEKFEVAS